MISFLSFLLVLGGSLVLIKWAIFYPRTFFSVVWRIFLFALLALSILIFCVYQNYHQGLVISGAIGILAASSGLVRSFFFKKAKHNDIEPTL
jgi:hypothetical protein